jgi:hypothetical protein
MRVYTVHIRPFSMASDRDAVLVRRGLSWPALCFGPAWALAAGLWLLVPALVGAVALLFFGLGAAGADIPAQIVIIGGFQVVVGLNVNDFQRWALARQGYAEVASVAAAGQLAAERRYFENATTPAGPAAPPAPPAHPDIHPDPDPDSGPVPPNAPISAP